MSDFRDAQQNAMNASHLSADRFAESIIYDDGIEREIVAHCRHAIEAKNDEDGGNESRVEILRVTIAVDSLANPPSYGDTITRSGETRAYLFAGEGRSNALIYKARFERAYIKQQGTP